MVLDINTEKGQVSLSREREAILIAQHYYPKMGFLETPKKGSSPIDGVFYNTSNNEITSIVEVKTRDITLDKFLKEYKGEWLVTFHKIEHGVSIAKAMECSFTMVFYLVKSNMVLIKKIWSPQNGFEADFYVKKTETQATVNGGLALRDNAFIDLNKATVCVNEKKND